jgi:hypothetical protein
MLKAFNAFKTIYTKTVETAIGTLTVITNRRGENFIDSGFKVLIVVVLAALLLAGLYALFGNVIMPTLTERVKDLFNYKG